MKYFKIINNNDTTSFIKCNDADKLHLTEASDIIEITESEYVKSKRTKIKNYDSSTDKAILPIKYNNHIA